MGAIEKTGGTTYYYLFDALGSVVAVITNTGSSTPVVTYKYSPYGKPTWSAPVSVDI